MNLRESGDEVPVYRAQGASTEISNCRVRLLTFVNMTPLPRVRNNFYIPISYDSMHCSFCSMFFPLLFVIKHGTNEERLLTAITVTPLIEFYFSLISYPFLHMHALKAYGK